MYELSVGTELQYLSVLCSQCLRYTEYSVLNDNKIKHYSPS